LAILWPAGALAAPSGADRDHNKVADGLERSLQSRSSSSKQRLIVSLNRRATAGRVEQLERQVGDMSIKHRFKLIDGVALTATKAQVARLARQGVVTRVSEDKPVHADSAFGQPNALNDSAQSSFGVTEARLDEPLLDGNADGDPNTYSPGDEVAAVLDIGHRHLPRRPRPGQGARIRAVPAVALPRPRALRRRRPRHPRGGHDRR